MDALEPLARNDHAAVVLGITLDDLGDHRPGIEASRKRGARFPLLDAGFTKADVRSLSRSLDLATWNKPAAPCLASRIPYDTPVSVEVLSRVEAGRNGTRYAGIRRSQGAPLWGDCQSGSASRSAGRFAGHTKTR